MKFLKVFIPLLILIAIVAVLWKGLYLNPADVPSPLINNHVPQMNSDTLDNKKLTEKDFLGHVSIFHVWATWCSYCVAEHDYLVALAKTEGVVFYSLIYKDDPDKTIEFLKENGNPYKKVGIDPLGITALDWGVYGTPETFVVDKKGVIRYRLTGTITPDAWNNDIKPLIQKLKSES